MKKKIFASEASNKGLMSKIYKQLMQLIIKKANNPIKCLFRSSKQTFLQRHTDGQKKKRKKKKYMKRCSTSLIIWEMKIKSTMKFHHMPARMAIIKTSTNNKFWRWYGEKGTFLQYWWEYKFVEPLWRTVWRFLKKTKTRTTVWSSNLTYRHLSRGKKIIQKEICTSKRNMYPNVHCSTIYNSEEVTVKIT